MLQIFPDRLTRRIQLAIILIHPCNLRLQHIHRRERPRLEAFDLFPGRHISQILRLRCHSRRNKDTTHNQSGQKHRKTPAKKNKTFHRYPIIFAALRLPEKHTQPSGPEYSTCTSEGINTRQNRNTPKIAAITHDLTALKKAKRPRVLSTNPFRHPASFPFRHITRFARLLSLMETLCHQNIHHGHANQQNAFQSQQ